MSASPRLNILGSVVAGDGQPIKWDVSYTTDGFLMRRLEPKKDQMRRPSTSQVRQHQQQQAEDTELKNSLLASTPGNTSNDSSDQPQRSGNDNLRNSSSGLPSAVNNKPADMQHSEQGRFSNTNIMPAKLAIESKYNRVSDSHIPINKLQESVSVRSQNQSSASMKKKVEKLQSHIVQLEERQRKLQSKQARMQDALLRVQQRTEQLPPISQPPKTVQMKKKSKTCRINSKLVSLTVENTPNMKKKRSMDTDRDHDELKHEIIELKELIRNMKEDQMKRAYLQQKEMDNISGPYDLPSIEGQPMSKTLIPPQKGSSQLSGSPYPSKDLQQRSQPKSKDRVTIGDMKTVFYNGAVQPVSTIPKTTALNEQASSEIDLQRDVFLPLNSHSKSGLKGRNKASAENFSNIRKNQPVKYTSFNRPPFDTRFDTTKKMEHNERSNEALNIDNNTRFKRFNPEDLDQEKFAQTRKSMPAKPIFNIPRKQQEHEKYDSPSISQVKREPKERYPAQSIPNVRLPEVEALNYARDDIDPNPQEQFMDQENPGEISVIELAQFRTSQDLNKKLVVFPKLPGPLNPLLNSEELTNLAKQTFAVFGYPVAENSALTIKKYRNCVYFCHQRKHILWHYSGKFYIGGWDGNGKQQGCKSGKGVELIPGNYIYEGQFNNGKRQGYGVVNSAKGDNYVGHWYQGLRHGKGRLEQSSGIIYDGHWKNGKKDGLGKLVFHGLEVYEGGFEDGLKHGFGRQQFRNKDTYKGEYTTGRFSGQGTYKWANGAVYQGQFLNGMRHGHGCWKSNRQGRSDTYEGDYFQDKKSGKGRYTWQNGTIYDGRFLNDMKHGEGELRYPDGIIIQGIWERGSMKYETFNSKNLPPAPPNFREEPTRAVQISGNFPF